MFGSVAVTEAERSAPLAGDGILPGADVVMHRGFTLDGGPEAV
jgi:hypothetical protein